MRGVRELVSMANKKNEVKLTQWRLAEDETIRRIAPAASTDTMCNEDDEAVCEALTSGCPILGSDDLNLPVKSRRSGRSGYVGVNAEE